MRTRGKHPERSRVPGSAISSSSAFAQQGALGPPGPDEKDASDAGDPPGPLGASELVAAFEDDGDGGACDADAGEDELVAEAVHELRGGPRCS